jgi:hypothetical protein
MQVEGGAWRPMTEDELEANGYPRNFHSMNHEERRAIEDKLALQVLRGKFTNPEGVNSTQIKFYEDTSTYAEPADVYLTRAKLAVLGSYNSTHEAPDQLRFEQLYIVWFSKVLKNWKALVSTSVAGDGLYFEVTYNGEPGREETYVDTYRKEDNQVFSNHDH